MTDSKTLTIPFEDNFKREYSKRCCSMCPWLVGRQIILCHIVDTILFPSLVRIQTIVNPDQPFKKCYHHHPAKHKKCTSRYLYFAQTVTKVPCIAHGTHSTLFRCTRHPLLEDVNLPGCQRPDLHVLQENCIIEVLL
jgi:hypothetical protein